MYSMHMYKLRTVSTQIPSLFQMSFVHLPCIFHTDSTHIPCIVHTYSMHIPYIFPTVRTYSKHIPYISHAHSTHIPCICHSYSMHIPVKGHACYTHIPYIVHTYVILATCTGHAYSTHTPHIFMHVPQFMLDPRTPQHSFSKQFGPQQLPFFSRCRNDTQTTHHKPADWQDATCYWYIPCIFDTYSTHIA